MSPDGADAVLSPQYGAYALVDLGTLVRIPDRKAGSRTRTDGVVSGFAVSGVSNFG